MPASAPRVALVDYGAGNLRSVAKALERSGMSVDVTSDPSAIARAEGVVLPGVGAFADARASLAAKSLDDAVLGALDRGRPYLGLCLGLQLLFDEADEHGTTPGFARCRGRVERFPDHGRDGARLLVPHIGWNEVRWVKSGNHPMLAALPERDHYYFVHSYRPVAADADTVVGWTDYGGEFAAAVAKEGIFAVQFHPEKSQAAGKRLLDAYAQWVSSCR
ncbi:MAG: imidazole glycerol phosphate synthase subunit HisH [Proteobacteria bacterium]|nr:MAG: imidazole glycerol phosphate synthase subunit HisH [Pseudomonadota bacterium]